jgi:hypothetical protein
VLKKLLSMATENDKVCEISYCILKLFLNYRYKNFVV